MKYTWLLSDMDKNISGSQKTALIITTLGMGILDILKSFECTILICYSHVLCIIEDAGWIDVARLLVPHMLGLYQRFKTHMYIIILV